MCKWIARFIASPVMAALSLLGAFSAPPASAQTIPTSSYEVATSLEALLDKKNANLILAPEKLHRGGLDFSLDSLVYIDIWLLEIHRLNLQESGQAGRAGRTLKSDQRGYYSVLLAGLYLGEVVKRLDNRWVWENFDTFIANNPMFAQHYSSDSGFDTVLLANTEGSATPINSALKRVLFGREESLHYIAHFLTTPAEIQNAKHNALAGGNTTPNLTGKKPEYKFPTMNTRFDERPVYLPDPRDVITPEMIQPTTTHPSHVSTAPPVPVPVPVPEPLRGMPNNAPLLQLRSRMTTAPTNPANAQARPHAPNTRAHQTPPKPQTVQGEFVAENWF